jgi:hypothetical protein
MIGAGSPEVVAAIRAKISARRLPTAVPTRVSFGRGADRRCDGCDQPITSAETEYEIELPHSHVWRLHRPCFNIWHVERVRLALLQ